MRILNGRTRWLWRCENCPWTSYTPFWLYIILEWKTGFALNGLATPDFGLRIMQMLLNNQSTHSQDVMFIKCDDNVKPLCIKDRLFPLVWLKLLMFDLLCPSHWFTMPHYTRIVKYVLLAEWLAFWTSGLPRSRPGFNSRSEHMTGSDSSIIGGPDSGKFVCPCRQ